MSQEKWTKEQSKKKEQEGFMWNRSWCAAGIERRPVWLERKAEVKSCNALKAMQRTLNYILFEIEIY